MIFKKQFNCFRFFTYQLIGFIFLCVVFFSCDEKEKEAATEQTAITNTIIYLSECKQLKSTKNKKGVVEINYDYTENNKTLTINHVNAVFNCCIEKIGMRSELVNNTLTITEYEENGFCYCTCLYDFKYEISNIPKAELTILILEPYINEDNKIEFSVDLANKPTGSYSINSDSNP